MEWSNDNVMEFLELLQYEPCLWNAKLKTNKNRVALNESWQRIIHSLSFPSTRDELKKKKDSLMGYYRIHLHKYKKSLKSGVGEDVYKTNWFAFELMDSFLRPVYLSDSEIDTVIPEEDSKSINESTNEDSQNGQSPSPEICSSNERKRTSFRHHYIPNQRFNLTPETNHTKKQNHDTSDPLEPIITTRCNREQLDEYDHFAFMIAAKIRKLRNSDDREILMNTIQNVAFDFCVKNKRRISEVQTTIKTSLSAQSSPVYNYHEK